MIAQTSPARALQGAITVPGDKSISHRYAMLTAIAQGESLIYNYSSGADCQSTLSCMGALGVQHEYKEIDSRRVLAVQGKGIHGLTAAGEALDAGNSGSTMRMLAGILSAQPFTTVITGDESLVKRPMRRIIDPLTRMGARIDADAQGLPPLTIHGSKLKGIDFQPPVASAQVKSCVLLAGLYAEGETIVREPIATRDHTEIALQQLGADVKIEPRVTRVRGGAELTGRTLVVPGDLSSAAFFLVAGLIVPDSNLIITNVGLNPTRTALLDVLRGMGADIRLLSIEQINGEISGNLQVKTSRMRGGVIEGATTAAVIDEIPILAILGTATQNGLVVRDAGELRVKETDRIRAMAENLQRMGVECRTSETSIEIPGQQRLHAAELQSLGDHRIAMAFAIAGLVADGPCTIHEAEAASVSFPEFYTKIDEISKR